MMIGVVKHGSIYEITAVQAFLGVGMKPDSQGTTAEKCQNAADPGKQLTVDDRVKFNLSHTEQGTCRVL